VVIRILLVDDHKIFREGLRSLLAESHDIEVIGEADNGRTALELLKKLDPDIVVTDISMPDMNGIEATRQILKRKPSIKIIALSMHSDGKFISNILKAGASGYLLKDCAAEELYNAIHQVYKNNVYLSPNITGIVIDDYIRSKKDIGSMEQPKLTTREREVLQLLAEGKSTSRIADTLYVSVKTIETHRSHIMEKLELRSIAELTKYAIKEGLTSLDN